MVLGSIVAKGVCLGCGLFPGLVGRVREAAHQCVSHIGASLSGPSGLRHKVCASAVLLKNASSPPSVSPSHCSAPFIGVFTHPEHSVIEFIVQNTDLGKEENQPATPLPGQDQSAVPLRLLWACARCPCPCPCPHVRHSPCLLQGTAGPALSVAHARVPTTPWGSASFLGETRRCRGAASSPPPTCRTPGSLRPPRALTGAVSPRPPGRWTRPSPGPCGRAKGLEQLRDQVGSSTNSRVQSGPGRCRPVSVGTGGSQLRPTRASRADLVPRGEPRAGGPAPRAGAVLEDPQDFVGSPSLPSTYGPPQGHQSPRPRALRPCGCAPYSPLSFCF